LISALLASAFTALLLAQAKAPAALPSPEPTPVATPAPAVPTTPTDEFGPDLKAWLDANKLQDKDSAARALANLQRRRAERSLSSVDDVAGAIAGRAEVRAVEGTRAEAAEAMDAAIRLAPDSGTYRARKADWEGKLGAAISALDFVRSNPFEAGRLRSVWLLGLLIVGALFATGFAFALLLRYVSVFNHDVSEGLPGPLKPLALFMAVLFLALPVAGLMGWGYLPFWWMTLFFIFATKPEKMVSIVLLVALAISGFALPLITHQRDVEATREARVLDLLARGGTSVEAENLVRDRIVADPDNTEWSLLAANLARRAGRFDEAAAALQARASSDPRFAHNAAALELNKGNFAPTLPAFTQASEAPLSSRDKATALYNLSLVEVNTLAFDKSKESRNKGDALDAALLARYDQLFSYDREGSTLHAPPDILPEAGKLTGPAIPVADMSLDNSLSRLSVIAIGLLLFIPGVVKFRGVQSFSKQCPKCGTTFCWLCQTRSTSQDVCSQCHYLFVVKRGIPPAARAAKNAEITNYVTRKALLHRIASFAAPGAGHLAVGHFNFGLPLIFVWAVSLGIVITVQFLAPLVVAATPLGSTLKMIAGVIALITYVAAQAIKPQPPVVAPAPRRVRPEQEAA
jgi:tetratricopeptide (TPR) repeat protein